MIKKLTIAGLITLAAVRGYRMLDERYGHLLETQELDLPPNAVTSPERYQLPLDAEPVIMTTCIGEVELRVADGYYGHAGIYVYIPASSEDVAAIAEEFNRLTKRQFVMDIQGNTSRREPACVIVLVSAGIDQLAYDRYHRELAAGVDNPQGNPGYHKYSNAPSMEMTERALRDIIDGPLRVRALRIRPA